ncbi:MAG: FAD-dependent oxidoreductase [Ruthenibacterium sp.]
MTNETTKQWETAQPSAAQQPVEQPYALVVIGGGPAGLAAALSAWEKGLKRILILERDTELGGILNQCIHNGFGLHHFKEELTGPEYAGRFVKMLADTGVEISLDTMVLDIADSGDAAHTKHIHAVSKARGYRVIAAQSVVLCMGCRERTRGAIAIPGTRPAGVFTAGTAQRYVNMEGYMVGRRVLILGSGDIGLIMARRMTLEGATVLACVEVMPYSGGLTRNIVQCLHDYTIPLYLSHTITKIEGETRVSRVTVAEVDAQRNPVPGTEMVFDCDTILLSVGLIPENELTREACIEMDARTNGAVVYENMETSMPGVFACGNVVHVHDLVDFVTAESQLAGASAASYVQSAADTAAACGAYSADAKNACTLIKADAAKSAAAENGVLQLACGEGVGYTVPQRVRCANIEKSVNIFFRVRRIYGDSAIVLRSGETVLARFKREHMAPGEMEHIILPKIILDRAKADVPLCVSVEDAAPSAAAQKGV